MKCFDHLFVQNEESVRLLEGIGVTRTTVVGDTRFDRVLEIRNQAKELPLVESFKGGIIRHLLPEVHGLRMKISSSLI